MGFFFKDFSQIQHTICFISISASGINYFKKFFEKPEYENYLLNILADIGVEIIGKRVGEKIYEELVNKEGTHVVVIGQTTCSHCIAIKPALNSIAGEYELTINYLK